MIQFIKSNIFEYFAFYIKYHSPKRLCVKKISLIFICLSFSLVLLGANTFTSAQTAKARNANLDNNASAEIQGLENKISSIKKEDKIKSLEEKLSKLENKPKKEEGSPKSPIQNTKIKTSKKEMTVIAKNKAIIKLFNIKYFLGLEYGQGSFDNSYKINDANGNNIAKGALTSNTASTYGIVGGFYLIDKVKFTITYNKYKANNGIDIESFSAKDTYLFRDKDDIFRPYIGLGLGGIHYTVSGKNIQNSFGVNKVALSSMFNIVLDAGLEFSNLASKNNTTSIDLGIREMYTYSANIEELDYPSGKTATFELDNMPKVYLDISYVF